MKLALGILLATAGVAEAHFALIDPKPYSEQDSSGSPQKSAPCGQADPGSTLMETGDEATFTAGQMVTVTVDERIFHPGHYRVALAQDLASLPDDPVVTAGSGTPCGTAAVMDSPTLPVLADNLLVHTSPFSANQSVQVQLPAGMTCAHCMLQVVEFMSDHPLNNPGGCFYHHCAKVSIVGTAGVDAPQVIPDAPTGNPTTGGGGGGGGCAVGGGGAGGLVALLTLALRRRRSTRSS